MQVHGKIVGVLNAHGSCMSHSKAQECNAADEEPAVVIMLFIILKDSVCIARRALNGVDGVLSESD